MINFRCFNTIFCFLLLMNKSRTVAEQCQFDATDNRDEEHCYPNDIDVLVHKCKPCKKDNWLETVIELGELANPTTLVDSKVQDSIGKCFNNDPLVVPKCHRSVDTNADISAALQLAFSPTKLDQSYNFAAFTVKTQQFFRYPLGSTGSGTGARTGSGRGIPTGSGPGTPTGSGPGTPTGSGPGTLTGSGRGIPTGSGPGTPTGSSRGTSTGSSRGTPTGSGRQTPTGSSGVKATVDLGLVESFYKKKDSDNGNNYDTDFEILEWPGNTLTDRKKFLEQKTRDLYGKAESVYNPDLHCYKTSDSAVNDTKDYCGHTLEAINENLDASCTTCKKCKGVKGYNDFYGNCTDQNPYEFVALHYGRKSSKFRYYPCNSVEGTYIIAMGLISPPDVDEGTTTTGNGNDGKNEKVNQMLYVASGESSMTRDYIQPFVVRKSTLQEMGQDESTKGCYKYDADLKDLRKVNDFEFTRNRLIIAMECGILILRNLVTPPLNVTTAKLWSFKGKNEVFNVPIHAVASSTCCLSSFECDSTTTIVAAYSIASMRAYDNKGTNLQHLYISYDLGDTFQTKIFGSEFTPLNLIKGMFLVYEHWAGYFNYIKNKGVQQIIADLKLKGKRKEKVESLPWDVMTIEQKEESLFNIMEGEKNSSSIISDIMKSAEKENNQTQAPQWLSKLLDEKFIDVLNNSVKNCEVDAGCLEKLEEDKVVHYLLSDNDHEELHIKAPKPNVQSNIYCHEVVSMEIEQEQNALVLLCRVGFGEKKDDYKYDSGKKINHFYAVYVAYLKPFNPIIIPVRKSQRMIRCKPADKSNSTDLGVLPDMIRVHGTSNYVIVNCDQVLYYSTNGCRTLYNAVFYYATPDTTKPTTPTPLKDCNINSKEYKEWKEKEALTYRRYYNFAPLELPPLAAVDPQLNYITLTIKDYYAYGAFSYNNEFRVLTGKILPHYFTDNTDKCSTIVDSLTSDNTGATLFVPWFTNSYRLAFAIPLIQYYKKRSPYDNFYKDRHALRLIEIPPSFYEDMKPFYWENTLILNNKAEEVKQKAFLTCDTFAFEVTPRVASLDIDKSVVLKVSVVDANRQLPLSIFSSQEKSVAVSTTKSNRSEKSLMHDWDVEITAIPYYKSRENAEIDAFFGSSYQNMEAYSTNLAIVNQPKIRCHVQPTEIVTVTIGCDNEVLIAHEEEYRPQCEGKFYNNFQYTLEKDTFDPEMMEYWIKRDEKNEFYSIKDDGSAVITYDYETFGCPLEPYRLDHFAPDLRIGDTKENENTEESELPEYKGEYVLIEVFGAKGFEYTKKVSDIECKRKPQNLKTQTDEWKTRRNVFRAVAEKLNQKDKFGESGNSLFDIDSVMFQQNIWNRANYYSCLEDQFIENKKIDLEKLDKDEAEKSYEIMKNVRGGTPDLYNEIVWSSKAHQRVYIFLVVAVDPYGTLCDLQAVFGVSLPYRHENNDLLSFLVFLMFVILWFLLCFLGYVGRRAYVKHVFLEEARVDRLEEAAWTIIYRYERIIHEQANRKKKQKLKKATGSQFNASNATMAKGKSKTNTKAK